MRTLYNSLVLALVIAFTPFPAEASASVAPETVCTDTLGVKVYYRNGYRILEPEYHDNSKRLDSFIDHLRELCDSPDRTLKRIHVISSASPTGVLSNNNSLSDARGTNVAEYIFSRVDVPSSLVVYQSLGEDWHGLTELVENSDMPYKEEALEIMRTSRGDERKRRLKALDGGSVWKYMSDNFFQELISASVDVICEFETEPESPAKEPEQEPQKPEPAVEPTVEPAPEPITEEPTGRRFVMAVKTNMLYDALLVPNLGVEFDLGRGWSIGANIQNAWWSKNINHRYWRIQGGELEVRKYFGSLASRRALSGHHLSLYVQAVNYDVEFGGRGYMGGLPGKDIFDKCSYGAGIEYGYSLPVSSRLNIDFGFGLGYFGGEYRKYDPIDTHYVYKSKHRMNWFGPTKAEISLVWLIGNGVDKRKGGAK